MNDSVVVRIRRPDGRETILRVRAEHLDRLLDLACREFGESMEVLEGPEVVSCEK